MGSNKKHDCLIKYNNYFKNKQVNNDGVVVMRQTLNEYNNLKGI